MINGIYDNVYFIRMFLKDRYQYIILHVKFYYLHKMNIHYLMVHYILHNLNHNQHKHLNLIKMFLKGNYFYIFLSVLLYFQNMMNISHLYHHYIHYNHYGKICIILNVNIFYEDNHLNIIHHLIFYFHYMMYISLLQLLNIHYNLHDNLSIINQIKMFLLGMRFNRILYVRFLYDMKDNYLVHFHYMFNKRHHIIYMIFHHMQNILEDILQYISLNGVFKLLNKKYNQLLKDLSKFYMKQNINGKLHYLHNIHHYNLKDILHFIKHSYFCMININYCLVLHKFNILVNNYHNYYQIFYSVQKDMSQGIILNVLLYLIHIHHNQFLYHQSMQDMISGMMHNHNFFLCSIFLMGMKKHNHYYVKLNLNHSSNNLLLKLHK